MEIPSYSLRHLCNWYFGIQICWVRSQVCRFPCCLIFPMVWSRHSGPKTPRNFGYREQYSRDVWSKRSENRWLESMIQFLLVNFGLFSGANCYFQGVFGPAEVFRDLSNLVNNAISYLTTGDFFYEEYRAINLLKFPSLLRSQLVSAEMTWISSFFRWPRRRLQCQPFWEGNWNNLM